MEAKITVKFTWKKTLSLFLIPSRNLIHTIVLNLRQAKFCDLKCAGLFCEICSEKVIPLFFRLHLKLAFIRQDSFCFHCAIVF